MKSICRDCGTIADPKSVTRGSIFIEIVLWLCFIVPGLIYSIWRLTTRHKACPACKSKNVIPVNTPAGSSLAAKYS